MAASGFCDRAEDYYEDLTALEEDEDAFCEQEWQEEQEWSLQDITDWAEEYEKEYQNQSGIPPVLSGEEIPFPELLEAASNIAQGEVIQSDTNHLDLLDSTQI